MEQIFNRIFTQNAIFAPFQSLLQKSIKHVIMKNAILLTGVTMIFGRHLQILGA